MILTGKVKSILEWTRGFDPSIQLNAITTEPGSRSVVIDKSSAPITEYIDGSARYRLIFSLVGMFEYSSFADSVNEDALEAMESWVDWIKDAGFPDFASGRIESVRPLETVPTLSLVYNQDVAKYQFAAEIIFTE